MKNETQIQLLTKSDRNGIVSKNGDDIVSSFRIDSREIISLRQAAEQGDADAQFRVAEHYYKSYEECCGDKEDLEEAVKWYQEAAGRGDARAQFEIGWLYQSGEGVEEDHGKAVEWYCLSAEQGYAKAQYWLGWCYQHGWGVEPDMAKAVKWYRLAAEQGNAEALEDLDNLALARGLDATV